MKALVVAPDTTDKIEIRQVAEPQPQSNEAVVRVAAISLNHGEMNSIGRQEDGARPGWDFAGTVETAAANGSGPRQGSRVVGFVWQGAWAELVAVDSANLAELPDNVSFEEAATLPVAGLTALQSLRVGQFFLGDRVLVTGASAGVGFFGVQLAAIGQGEVTAVSTKTERHAVLRELGATNVVTKVTEAEGLYRVILDGVGGSGLADALQKVTKDGYIVNYGNTSGQDTTFNAYSFLGKFGAKYSPFQLTFPITHDLAVLVRLVSEGKLKTEISLQHDWHEIGTAVQALRDRQIFGKAVLTLS